MKTMTKVQEMEVEWLAPPKEEKNDETKEPSSYQPGEQRVQTPDRLYAMSELEDLAKDHLTESYDPFSSLNSLMKSKNRY